MLISLSCKHCLHDQFLLKLRADYLNELSNLHLVNINLKAALLVLIMRLTMTVPVSVPMTFLVTMTVMVVFFLLELSLNHEQFYDRLV